MKHLIKRIVIAGVLFCATASAATQQPWLSKALSNADARHLISRTGFGVSANELKALRGLSRAQAIEHIIQGFSDTPELPMPAWTAGPAPLYWTRKDLSPEEKRRFDRERDSEFAELRQWWTNNLLATRSPQSERMVLFWHDHFATSYHSIDRQSIALARQNQTFRNSGMGDFKHLVKAMIKDPALLNYLDNLSNRKGAPNENLARELLELFTLGEGNYAEQTVREAARSLTGYNVSQNKNLSFEFQVWSHDNGQKNLFGHTANFDGDDLVDQLFQQPALARFMAAKFWHAFIADHPPSSHSHTGQNPIEKLARTFQQSDFNISSLYRATIESEEFWSDESRAGLVKSPVQLIVGFARSMEYPKNINQQIPSLLARSGMDLFAPPNVSGWDEGDAWITTGRLLNRYNAIDNLAISGSAADVSSGDRMAMMATEKSMTTGNNNSAPNAMLIPSKSTQPKNTGKSQLKVLLAAEDYYGPVNYEVELIDTANNAVWNSGKQILAGGHDTRKYGRLRIPEDLAWQTVNFEVPKSTLAEAEFLQVHFLNDKAGDDGDRNMYVDGISLESRWLDSSHGKQSSNCAPTASADAGNLYCAGSISLPLKEAQLSAITPSQHLPADPQASSVHVQWVRWMQNTDQLDLTLTLQNLHTASSSSPVYSFHLRSINGGEPQLELQSYGCWPECVEQWPDCSWTNPHHPDKKALVFPMSGAADNDHIKCHYDSLTQAEKKLVHSLMASAPSLLNEAVGSHRLLRPEQRKAVAQWHKLFKKYRSQLTSGHYDSSTTPQIAINKKMKINKPVRWPAQHIPTGANSLTEHGDNLIRDGITLSQLLLPGMSESQFRGLDQLAEKPIAVQLQALINHPSFQLH